MNKEKEDTGKKNIKTTKSSGKTKSFFTDERIKFVIGILITGFASVSYTHLDVYKRQPLSLEPYSPLQTDLRSGISEYHYN